MVNVRRGVRGIENGLGLGAGLLAQDLAIDGGGRFLNVRGGGRTSVVLLRAEQERKARDWDEQGKEAERLHGQWQDGCAGCGDVPDDA